MAQCKPEGMAEIVDPQGSTEACPMLEPWELIRNAQPNTTLRAPAANALRVSEDNRAAPVNRCSQIRAKILPGWNVERFVDTDRRERLIDAGQSRRSRD